MNAMDRLLDRWIASVREFAAAFRILNKNRDTVDFDVSVPQQTVFDLLDSHKKLIFLKGRQMWITTAVAVFALRLCLLRPGSNIAVALQSDTNATLMSRTYLGLYKGNPILVDQMPIAAESGHRIAFANGSQILFNTANSQVLRSMPFNFVHGTECSIYDDLGDFLASVAVAPDGWTILESTAHGQTTFAEMWYEKTSAFKRAFLCWRQHLEYRDARPIEGPLLDFEREYILLHRLTIQEAQWWVRYYRSLPASKRRLVMQEMPSTADEAFLKSGDRYLLRDVPVVPEELQKLHPVDSDGICRIHPYDPTHRYSAGIDLGAGSQDGDSSTVVIKDITLQAIAVTMDVLLPLAVFKPLARRLLYEYGDPLTAPETAQGGVDFCDYLRTPQMMLNFHTKLMEQWPGVPLYQMTAYSGLSLEMLPRHGWRTDETSRPFLFGKIYNAAIGDKKCQIGCSRLVFQLNSLCYRGSPLKPQAPRGQHDDLVVGFGLAEEAESQARPPRQLTIEESKQPSLLELHEKRLKSAPDSKGLPSDNFDTAILGQSADFFP